MVTDAALYGFSNPETVAKQVAAVDRLALVGIGNCGRKTIAEIEAWIDKYGCRWGRRSIEQEKP